VILRRSGTDRRFHTTNDLGSGGSSQLELADGKGAEALRRAVRDDGGVIIADLGYAKHAPASGGSRFCAEIAAMHNQKAWRPPPPRARSPKRLDMFNASMVRHLLTSAGIIAPGACRPRVLRSDSR
jgi:hypothetical protein